MAATPSQSQKPPQTPATLTAANSNKDVTTSSNVVSGNLGLHKQLKYEESPSLANHTTDLVSFKYLFGYFARSLDLIECF